MLEHPLFKPSTRIIQATPARMLRQSAAIPLHFGNTKDSQHQTPPIQRTPVLNVAQKAVGALTLAVTAVLATAGFGRYQDYQTHQKQAKLKAKQQEESVAELVKKERFEQDAKTIVSPAFHKALLESRSETVENPFCKLQDEEFVRLIFSAEWKIKEDGPLYQKIWKRWNDKHYYHGVHWETARLRRHGYDEKRLNQKIREVVNRTWKQEVHDEVSEFASRLLQAYPLQQWAEHPDKHMTLFSDRFYSGVNDKVGNRIHPSVFDLLRELGVEAQNLQLERLSVGQNLEWEFPRPKNRL